MKRCPKCSRTFPDENQKFCTVDGGLLIAAQPAFDPNATIRATAADLAANDAETTGSRPTSRELPDLNATVMERASAKTEVLPRNTGSTGAQTVNVRQPQPQPPPPPIETPPPPVQVSTGPISAPLPTHEKSGSKLPWILGGVALLLLLGLGGVAALFFFVVQPRLEQLSQRAVVTEPSPVPQSNQNSVATSTPTPETRPEILPYEPGPGMTQFVNSEARLDGKLADHYIDFSFYYPQSWQVDPQAGVPGASNFARVMKMEEDDTGEYLLESAALSWYNSNGTYDADAEIFPERAKTFSEQLAPSFPGYKKVSEGPTEVNSLKAYEFRFSGVFKGTGKGDLPYFGRAIFVPRGVEGEKNGIVIVMLATSLAHLNDVSEVGEKGELPVILDSFRFGKS
jgi:hypothetical protein